MPTYIRVNTERNDTAPRVSSRLSKDYILTVQEVNKRYFSGSGTQPPRVTSPALKSGAKLYNQSMGFRCSLETPVWATPAPGELAAVVDDELRLMFFFSFKDALFVCARDAHPSVPAMHTEPPRPMRSENDLDPCPRCTPPNRAAHAHPELCPPRTP